MAQKSNFLSLRWSKAGKVSFQLILRKRSPLFLRTGRSTVQDQPVWVTAWT